MKQRSFGCTGAKLSEFCLGTMNFGWRISESTSLAILDAYHAAGGNFIQALAPAPGIDDGPASVAASEAVVGRWWRSRDLARRTLFLATRVSLRGSLELAGPSHAEQLRQTVAASLTRFRTDYLDLLVCEWPAPQGIAPATREMLNRLIRTGQVRYLAFAGLPAWQVVDEIHGGYRDNHVRTDALQADYSLLARAGVETELAGVCQAYRLGFVARSPLAGGLLAKREGSSLALGTSRLRWLVERYGFDCGARVVRTVNQLAGEYDRSPAQIALAWVLHSPHVTSALIGVNSVALLRELMGAGALVLNGPELERLDRASTVQRTHLPLRPVTTASSGPTSDNSADACCAEELLTT